MRRRKYKETKKAFKSKEMVMQNNPKCFPAPKDMTAKQGID